MQQATVPKAQAMHKAKDVQVVLLISVLLPMLISSASAEALPQSIALPIAIMRVPIGLAYVLYLPGYCLSAAFFARSDDIDSMARAGLSLGLSLAWLSILALVLDQLPWGLRLWPLYVGNLLAILLFSMIALWRRSLLPLDIAYSPTPRWHPRLGWRTLRPYDQRIYALCATLLAMAALSTGYVFLVPSADEFVSEFYILGADGLAESYPQTAAVAEPLSITMGVVNRERSTRHYFAEVWAVDPWEADRRQLVRVTKTLSLERHQGSEFIVNWSMPWKGDDQYVDLLLFMDDREEPYRQLRLWLNVTE